MECSREVALELCVPFEHSIFVNVEDLVNALNSPLISSIPFDRYIDLDSAMNDSAFFASVDGREAVEFVRAFECFELRSKELRWVTGKSVVICANRCLLAKACRPGRYERCFDVRLRKKAYFG